MDYSSKIKYSSQNLDTPINEFIKINRPGNSHHGFVTGGFRTVEFIDKETNLFVKFAPSFDVTAYGETKKEVEEMMQEAIKAFLDYLFDLPIKKMEQELLKLGWKHHKLKRKEYSKSYVDISGELKNFALNEEVLETMAVFS